MRIKKQKSKDNLEDLRKIVELLEKLVYLNELAFLAAGKKINYPNKEG